MNKTTFKMPTHTWEEGILYIMRAFHGVPPDIEEWNIGTWNDVVALSKKIVEYEFKKPTL